MYKLTKISLVILAVLGCMFFTISPAYALSMEIAPLPTSNSTETITQTEQPTPNEGTEKKTAEDKIEKEEVSEEKTPAVEKPQTEIKTETKQDIETAIKVEPATKPEKEVNEVEEVTPQVQEKAEISATNTTSNNSISMKCATPKNGWVTENGKVHYYNNSKIQTGWVVNDTYKNYGLQRYWMGAYGDLVSGGKIVNVDRNGYLTYCSNAGYVARNKFAETNGKFYLADNGGKLETTTGWLVTGKYDGGGLQRYYLDSSFSVKRGEYWISSACYYGDWNQGYCFRNGFRVRNNEVWWADNDGVHTYYVKKCCNDDNVSIRIAYLWKDTMGGLWGDTARRAFDYVKNFRYIDGSLWPGGDWAPGFAMEMLNNGGGNCYRYAALFTMMIRAAGFNANAISGSHNYGGIVYAHGWTEVYHWDGKTYVCDPDGEHEQPGRNWYWVTYENAPLAYRK